MSLRGPIDHWYRVAVPTGENTLTIELTGDPTVRTAVTVENAAGETIPLRRIDVERLLVGHERERRAVHPADQ